MTRSPSIAERLSEASLTLLALVNAIVFASFLLVAALLAARAHAEGAACIGHDLVAELEKSNPALLDKVRAEAAAVPNSDGLLWKIDKDGLPPSYLFGTMHVTDPRVVALTPKAKQAFDGADTLVIETTDILDRAKLTAAMMQRLDLTMFTDATTLQSLMKPDDLQAVDAALSARGVPLASVAKMKPWLLSTLLAVPACENARKGEGALVLDETLAADAKKAGKAVGGLETAISQIEAMNSLPLKLHVGSLVETAKLGTRMDDVFETMIVLYQKDDTAMIWPLIRAVLPEEKGEAAEDYQVFEQTMIVKRNHGMAVNAVPFLTKGKAFIAVGAMHLSGPEGLVELLRKQGFAVTRAD